MISGTLSERHTFDKLHHDSIFVDLSDAGLLQDKNKTTIEILPDGIAVITIEDDTQVMTCDDIKN